MTTKTKETNETPATAPETQEVPVTAPETNETTTAPEVQAVVPIPTPTPAPTPAPAPAAQVPAPAPVPPQEPDMMAGDYDEAAWDEATRSDYVMFTEPAIVTFLTNNFRTLPKDGGKVSWEFDVMQNIDGKNYSKILGTMAKGLMRQLKDIRPLANKRCMITRSGTNFQTKYTVKPLV